MPEATSFVFFCAAVVGIVLAAVLGLAPGPASPLVRFLLVTDLAVLSWTAAYGVQLTWGHYADPALAPFGSPEYLLLLLIVGGIGVAGTYWFLFAATLNPAASYWTHGRGFWLAHVPAVYALLVAATNPFSHLFIRAAGSGTASGPLAWVHYAFSVGLAIASIVLIVWPPVPGLTRVQRRQRGAVALAAALPLAGSLVWMGRRLIGWPIPFNPTPTLFTVVACVLAYEVLYRGFGDIVPLTRLSSMIENTGALLAYLSPDFRFVSANEPFRKCARHIEEELLGRPYFDILPDQGRRQLFERARMTRSIVERTHDPDVLPRPAGQPSSVWNWSLTPVKDGNGELSGFVLSLTDVTESAREHELACTLSELEVRIQRGFASDAALWQVVRQAGDALGCDTVAVTDSRERGWRLRDSRTGMHPEPFDRRAYPHLAAALEEPRTIVIVDARIDERFDPATLAAHSLRSALIVPLRLDEGPAGVMCFQCRDTSRAFTTPQVEFAERFASSVALGLQNARLYQDERHIAQTLQESMLHVSFEHPGVDFWHTYRSASEAARVGGDFYDVFGTDDGRIALLIGDVAGHGIEAAVLTSLIKHSVRSATMEHRSPARIMSSASQMLWRETDPGMFATAFFGLLDPADGSLTYCSAGHPPALVVRLGGEVDELSNHSIVLGFAQYATYEEASDRLAPGETLVLYTDGLTEARRAREFYGSERLSAELGRMVEWSAEEVVGGLFRSVRSFANGVLSDDLALLAMRLLEEGATVAERAALGSSAVG